jgi:hypothetical protein
MTTNRELDPLLTNCQYTAEMEKWPLNFSHYVMKYHLTVPICKTEGVQRYVSQENPYPEGMIEDNLSCHLQRGFKYLTDILEIVDENDVDKNYAILMWLLHDLGELRASSEECAIDNPDNVEEEYEYFLSLINDGLSNTEEINHKIGCYEEYNKASAYLKGEITPPPKIDKRFVTGLLVRVVDSVDGNLFIQEKRKDWIEKGNKFPEEHPSIPYTFKQREKYLEQLDLLPDFNTKALLTFLINNQVEHIKKIWEGNEYKMPNSLYKHLYRQAKPIPFFKGNAVNIKDYEDLDLKEDPSFVILFDKVIYYFSLDNGISYSSTYMPLTNKTKDSFVLTINNGNGSVENIFIKTESSMSENELNLIYQHKEIIEKAGCVGDITYGKKTRQYFSLTEEGEPYTFGVARIKR